MRRRNQIPLMLTDEELAKIENKAKEMEGSRNQIIRYALKIYFKNMEQQNGTN